MLHRITLPVIVAVCVVALFIATPVNAQYGNYPRVYLTNPVSCSDPQTEPLPIQDEYVISDEMTSEAYNQWVFVDSADWNIDAIVYICPPADWSNVNVTLNAYHHSYGSYRNEHELNVVKGSFIEELWETAYGGSCGGFTTTATDEVITIPAVGDPAGSGPYQIKYSVRAYSKASCMAHAEHELSITFDGYETIKSDYCGDGIEVLEAGPVYMPSYSSWEASLVTGTVPFDRAWVTYVYSDPVDDMAQLWVQGDFNGTQLNVRDSGYQELRSMSVPNRTDPYHRDPFGGGETYDPYGFVSVPPVDLQFSTSTEIYLLSVCVREAPLQLAPSELCPDGLEALVEPLPVADYAGRTWEETVVITATHIAVRYVVENPYYPVERLGGGFLFEPDIDGRSFLVDGTWHARQLVTYTLPTTSAIALNSESLVLGFANEGPQVTVRSICIIDAAESMPQLREGECHLHNPDFVQGLGGWAVGGNIVWDSDTGNGAANADGGGVIWQEPLQDTGTVWRMELRARAVGAVTGTLEAGTNTENIVAGGAQLYTHQLESEWMTLAVDIFVEEASSRLSGGYVQVRGDNAQVDYVCLGTPDDAMPVPECVRPEWNPAGSGDPLYTYLFKYLAEWGMYIGCLIVRAISIAYNGIIHVLENIVLRIPNFDPNDGILGAFDWLNAVVFRMLDWIGATFSGFFQWLDAVIADFGFFMWEIVLGFIAFLGDLLGFDPFALLAEMNDLWNETLWFWRQIQTEIGYEWGSAINLLQNMGNVMMVLVDGVRGGLNAETGAYLGEDIGGVGAFIWEGVSFVSEAVEGTPLTALNIIALAVITLTLSQWTLKKFTTTLEFLGR